jgi:hypothetical protein
MAAITFKSAGHFFASVFQKSIAELPKIIATAGTVETVTGAVPTYGPLAVTVEKAAYAVLGEVAAVLNASDAAGKTKLADAGMDVAVIETVEAILKSVPEFTALLKSL